MKHKFSDTFENFMDDRESHLAVLINIPSGHKNLKLDSIMSIIR